ncbi:MAG: Zn-dependent oligopeptidase [Deltaproteobacteria bacterium]|nr:Zn-dependent oligopeptidase [Deltaproteobacteria bacterium]
MYRRLNVIVAIVAMVSMVAGCSKEPAPEAQKVPSKETPPAPEAKPTPTAAERTAPPIWKSVTDVKTACKKHLDAAKKIRDELVAVEGARTLENTLQPINNVLIEVDAVMPMSELITNVHPEKKVRDAAEKCQQDAKKFESKFKLDREVYDALVAVKTDGLDAKTQRFVKHLLRDYRRSGVDKDEATRGELATLKENMVKTGQVFAKRIREDKRFIEVTAKELAGMPEDFMASHPADKNGKIKITTDYPDFIPVTNYAENEATRRAIYIKFLERAHPDNGATMKKLLELRHTYAAKLGYSDWADYNAEDKMTKNKQVISEFIDKVAGIARPRMEKDLAEILARKTKDDKQIEKVKKQPKKVRMWDRFYYVNKIKAEKYEVDAQVVRGYFNYPKVKEGLFAVNQQLYGVTFKRIPDAPVWHESVEAYDMLDGEEVIARFYLDMHPRDGKYGHAAEFPMITGIPGRQPPSASLVCNFPKPSDKGPALMGHSEVTTFFHEFGHLMHQLLAGRHEWVTLSGINCEWDFVEAPSQLMEDWAWDYDVLKNFAVHHETGEVIPEELVKKMRAADEFGKGVHVMRQMFYAGLSFTYHASDPAGIDLLEVVKDMQKKYNPYPYEKGTYVFANFGHLEGYSSMYYTYMWSLVMAKDLLTKFNAAGLMNKENAMAYRKYVLEPGGTVDAAEMVKNFLGRDYAFDAFKTWLEKE